MFFEATVASKRQHGLGEGSVFRCCQHVEGSLGSDGRERAKKRQSSRKMDLALCRHFCIKIGHRLRDLKLHPCWSRVNRVMANKTLGALTELYSGVKKALVVVGDELRGY